MFSFMVVSFACTANECLFGRVLGGVSGESCREREVLPKNTKPASSLESQRKFRKEGSLVE